MLIKQPEDNLKQPQETCDLFFEIDLKGSTPKPPPLQRNGWWRPSFILTAIISILAVIAIILPYLDFQDRIANAQLQSIMSCETSACSGSIVESIPEGLIYEDGSVHFPSTYDTWHELIESANHSIDIASFYWSLRNEDVTDVPTPSANLGESIFNSIINKGHDRNIIIRVVQNQPKSKDNNFDTNFLMENNLAEVRHLNVERLVGAGILHTKFIIIDKKDFYLGSANMDWRSLTQVKELGIGIKDCSCVAQDLGKIFEVYWLLAEDGSVIPPSWPSYLSTSFNKESPMPFNFNSAVYPAYLSSSPPSFCPEGRTSDIDALLDVVSKARKFIYIAVMDYLPMFAYQRDAKFWPVIDNALRSAAMGRVEVRLLISHWNHTRKEIQYFLRSLVDLTGMKNNVVIKAKFFQVPSDAVQSKIPFARVNHNKYMVTDNSVFIGTSNWSADYFVNTGGVSLIAHSTNSSVFLVEQLKSIFLRDWDSKYAYDIPDSS